MQNLFGVRPLGFRRFESVGLFRHRLRNGHHHRFLLLPVCQQIARYRRILRVRWTTPAQKNRDNGSHTTQ